MARDFLLMTNSSDFIMAFLIGLSGSLHCAGMCGPLVAALGAKLTRPDTRSKLLFSLQYTLGRLLVYSALGMAAGLLGGGLLHSTSLRYAQQGVALLGGITMIFIGLSFLHLMPGRRFFEGGGFVTGGLLNNSRSGLSAGLLMGFLPCGMVYALVAKAASSAHPLQGGLLMLSFGMGTLPAMTLAGLTSRLLERGRGRLLLHAAYILVILMGIVTMGRGWG